MYIDYLAPGSPSEYLLVIHDPKALRTFLIYIHNNYIKIKLHNDLHIDLHIDSYKDL